MSRILIDLTDLELWSGQHGGTQRVVYGIAKNYFLQQENLKESVQFISFSAKDRVFLRTDFSSIYERVEALHNSADDHSMSARISRKAMLKQKVRPYIPEFVRQSDYAKRVALKSYILAKNITSTLNNTVKINKNTSVTSSGAIIKFVSTDIVLILGKPWDNLDIQKYLTTARLKVHFKLVQVVYDMIIPLHPHLHHPSLFTSYTQHMFEAISASDLLLPISQSSANDVKEFCKKLNLKIPPMELIRLGDMIMIDTAASLKPDSRINNKFIACIGTIEIRKNHMLLYYAYKLAKEQEVDLPQLVIVGGRGWLSGDFQHLAESDPYIKSKILILDNVNDDGLTWIYRNCTLTVYPSMYEGWGLPVAESLVYGKLCLASNASSVPEIAGSLIDYYSPYNPQDCLDVLKKYVINSKLLKNREKQIKIQYQPTLWRETYESIVTFLSRNTEEM